MICLSPSCSLPLIIGVAYDTLWFSVKATDPEQDKSTALGACEMLACLGLSGWLARSLRMCWRQHQVWVTFGVQCVCWDCRTQPKLSPMQLPADWLRSLIDCREAATVNSGTGQRIYCSLKGVLCDCVGACSASKVSLTLSCGTSCAQRHNTPNAALVRPIPAVKVHGENKIPAGSGPVRCPANTTAQPAGRCVLLQDNTMALRAASRIGRLLSVQRHRDVPRVRPRLCMELDFRQAALHNAETEGVVFAPAGTCRHVNTQADASDAAGRSNYGSRSLPIVEASGWQIRIKPGCSLLVTRCAVLASTARQQHRDSDLGPGRDQTAYVRPEYNGLGMRRVSPASSEGWDQRALPRVAGCNNV